MKRASSVLALPLALVVLAEPAYAFRNCERLPDDHLYRGSSNYQVSELEFDPLSRSATGTETHYNYFSLEAGGIVECHITYELNGIYDEASALFLLDADRRNLSVSCDRATVDVQFPDYLSYSLTVRVEDDSRVLVSRADSGEVLARGDWNRGYLTYKTGEHCELY